jgi:microsomal dipeptidase-like Zn-dependent dipeptidase
VDLVGAGHVALGSDFDGAVTTGFDSSAMPSITQALVDAGLDEDAIRGALGGNALRLFREVLPESCSRRLSHQGKSRPGGSGD